MLKIKDNVDLKELEKFGFYKINESYMQPYGYDIKVEQPEEKNSFAEKGFAMLEVDGFGIDRESDRTLHLYTTTDDEVWWDIDIIFDLIQAGLIEKVEEQNGNQ